MRRWLWIALVLGACSHAQQLAAPGAPPEQPEPVLTLPEEDSTPIAARLIITGDGGEPGAVHDAVFGTARVLASRAHAPVLVMMPGDLTYPKGLPDLCSDASKRLQKDYLSVVPDVPFVVVPGNHDHGDLDKGTNLAIASRDSWFDCSQQSTVTSVAGWVAKSCACDPRWHAPLGLSDVATWRPEELQPERLAIVAYDSQQALVAPERVAGEVGHALDGLAPGERAIVLAHHPLATVGTHGAGTNPQDAGSATYQAYAKAMKAAVEPYAPKILLLVFGHDHNMQYEPGSPPQLISGAASKMSPLIAQAPKNGFAAGNTAGLAVLDFLPNGDARLTVLWSGSPWTTMLAASRPVSLSP